MKQLEKNDLFQASQLTILLSYSVFSVILIAESLVLSWEVWPLFVVACGLVLSWYLHLQQRFTGTGRIWFYSAFIMFSFFFYGSHSTSVFDTVTVMSVGMLLYTMSGIKPLITTLQMLYYFTMAFGIWMLWKEGTVFDRLIVSRIMLHLATVTAVSHISRTTVNKWMMVLDSSHNEIEKLTDTTERLNDFLANVSHETRTPINAIIGLTGICIDEEQNDEKRQKLVAVRDAGRRVAEQISDILDFTEIDRKKLTNNFEDYMLSSVLNDLVEEIRPFKPNELELVIDVDPAIPSVMNTDISKLRKILRHLIVNGIKYTKEGGVYVRLYAIREEYGVNLVIRVTDTGIGMSEDEVERICDRYYQADSGRTRQSGGLGLGLTIVAGFTASLGGFMTVSSQPGVGTSVSVSIPQKVVEPSSCMSVAQPEKLCLGAFLHLDKYADPNVREYYNIMIHNIVKGFGVQMHRVDNAANLKKLLSSVRLTHLFVSEEEYEAAPEVIESAAENMVVVVVANHNFELPAGSKARIMEKPFYCFPVAAVLNAEYDTSMSDGILHCEGVHALVVDDEPMNLTVAQNILKRYGMTVSTAASGMEAVTMCKDCLFDIVFMDHMMPGMDGIEAMKRIRAGNAANRSDIPIVALTANAVSTARETFLSVGFDGFVSKPIELVELERVLRRVLPKSSLTVQFEPVTKPAPVAEKPQPVPETVPEPEEEPVLKRLQRCGLDTADALRYCADDEEFYLTLLEQFADETEEKIVNMREFLAENDLVNYEIIIHALKNTLKLIGSGALSERAKALEFAAKDNDSGKISQEHEPLMADCRSLVADIRAILGTGSNPLPAEPEAAESEPDDADEILEFEPFDGEED